MVLEAVTLNLPSIVHNHYLTAEPFVPIVTYYPLSFGKLGEVHGKLPPNMQIFNCDETGVSVVHKPGKVLAQLDRRNVHSITSGEKRILFYPVCRLWVMFYHL